MTESLFWHLESAATNAACSWPTGPAPCGRRVDVVVDPVADAVGDAAGGDDGPVSLQGRYLGLEGGLRDGGIEHPGRLGPYHLVEGRLALLRGCRRWAR